MLTKRWMLVLLQLIFVVMKVLASILTWAIYPTKKMVRQSPIPWNTLMTIGASRNWRSISDVGIFMKLSWNDRKSGVICMIPRLVLCAPEMPQENSGRNLMCWKRTVRGLSKGILAIIDCMWRVDEAEYW